MSTLILLYDRICRMMRIRGDNWKTFCLTIAGSMVCSRQKIVQNHEQPIRKKRVTQFISHRLYRWEFKRFYRYREGMLDGCKPDRCRRLMNWNKFFLHTFYNLLVCASRTTTTKTGWGKQDLCQWLVGQVVIKTNRSAKTEIKKKIKKSATTSRGGPGPFQGPSSYPQLCWWPLISLSHNSTLHSGRNPEFVILIIMHSR